MSSTGQATSSASNIQLFIDALADYAKTTGIDLARNPFAAALEQSSSPEAILQLLHDREKAFKEYRDGDRRLLSRLSPAVKILQALSGILGEAAGLIPFSPANVLFAGIDALLAAACGVSSSYDALLDLFECLDNFLQRLEIYTTIPPTPMMTDIIIKIMVQLLSVLALATKQIKQGRFKKFAMKLLGDSEVEAVVQRLDRLTQEEARMAATQTLGVVHGLVDNMKVVMEDGKASTESFRQDLIALHQVLHEMNKIKSDQLRLFNIGSPPDPSTNHKFVREARHYGTATWFFESDALTEWKMRGSLLWIHGKPGAGKSTLLSAIIHDVEGMRAAGLATMAYYYFDFRDFKKQDCHGLLSSLISQLSSESDSCFQILSELYSDHGRGIRQPEIDALKKCVTDMLSLPGQAPIYIIVDAIDECPNSPNSPDRLSAREEVLELIQKLVDLKLPSVHLCVASRPEMDIRDVFEPLTSLKISLHDESGQKEDIIEYIRSVLRLDRSMRRWKEEDRQFVMDTLSDRADGMFRWVVCQFDRLRRTFPANIRTVLNDLPKTLDETYDRILQGIGEEKREYAQRLLRCLTVSIRPLRVEELAEIFAVQFCNAAQPTFNAAWRPEDAEDAVLSACSGLVTIVDRGGYHIAQFSHYSVKEYLTSERLKTAKECLSYYHILLESAHTTLALAGLSVLLQLDDKIDRNTIDQLPLALYAARHWVEHAQYGNVSCYVEEVMERLFDRTKPHFAAWVWLYDIDHPWVDPMSKIHPTEPEGSPLYYAALCGFSGLVRHLLDSHSPDKNAIGGSHKTRLHCLYTVLSGFRDLVGRIVSHSPDTNSRGGSHASTRSGFRVRGLVEHRTAHSGDVNIRGGSFTTPLDAASLKGHLDVASLLLENGADPNSRDNEGGTPLHKASLGGQFGMAKSLEIVRLLVNYGANVKAADGTFVTPLHEAARSGSRDIAELLVESGASLDARNWGQATPLHFASFYGMLNMARFLLDRGSDMNSRQYDGTIPLHVASRSGHVDNARLLLDRGCDVNARDTKRWTPLHHCSQDGHPGAARFLIDCCADVNAHAADRSTPIHIASGSGYLDIAKLLIERGANVDSRNDKESTPLHRAAENGYLDIARFLIESGATLSARDNQGWIPFHKASYCGHLQIAKFLLECGVDVDIRNQNEESSLHLASCNGKLDVARFLIEQGADIHAKDHKGSNALHTASANGQLDVVRMLIDIGIAIDIRDESRETPLALASSNGEMEVGRFLIKRGADVNVRDGRFRAPLHFASRHGHLESARLLLDHGADANIQRDDLCSPLHLASAHDHLKIAELLIQRGANVDVFNEKEKTPLYRAARNGKFAIVRLLVDHGANVHSADCDGRTALHTASQHGHLGVAKLLLVRGADVDVLDKVNKTAAKLASENGRAKVAKFIAKYKGDAHFRKKLCSTTLDTAEYGRKKKGNISLHAAVEEEIIEDVGSLLERGADVNGRNAGDETPLHTAVLKRNVDVMRLLIEWGAEVDSRSNWGGTPLHYVSRHGHLEASRMLLNHGADVNARTNRHWTLLHFSSDHGYLEIVKLLLEHGADIFARNDEDQTPYQLSLRAGIEGLQIYSGSMARAKMAQLSLACKLFWVGPYITLVWTM